MNNTLSYTLLIFLLTLLLVAASCRRSEIASNQNGGASNANSAAGETLRTPPFPTKEPERYQAKQVETISSADGSQSLDYQVFIARDGERRRTDLETPSGAKISRLELPSGTYFLAPERKIYTELTAREGSGQPGPGVPQDFLPDKLLNEPRPETLYEKLGSETVNGRATVKYRVTLVSKTGAGNEVRVESFIWVDESLGMPVKSEMTSPGNVGLGIPSGARVTMELRDISETVDPGLFELPPDYKKVDGDLFYKQLNQADSPQKGRD